MTNETGGSAFPRPKWWPTDGDPDVDGIPQGGMTLRDYFAAQAMAALTQQREYSRNPESTAEDAYAIADAMLRERYLAQSQKK